MKLNSYVVGFMFSPALDLVLLIKKQKPVWQKGKLNGIGGSVELGETIENAMAREFKEETGFETLPSSWTHFLLIGGSSEQGDDEFVVDCFACKGDIQNMDLKNSEGKGEVLEIHPVSSLYELNRDGLIVENVPWMVPLAIDTLVDGRPRTAIAAYGNPQLGSRAQWLRDVNERTPNKIP